MTSIAPSSAPIMKQLSVCMVRFRLEEVRMPFDQREAATNPVVHDHAGVACDHTGAERAFETDWINDTIMPSLSTTQR
ncbi:MAG: hypothetical protein R2845_14165 [Thermomicrobiales bacterium]